MEFRLRLFNSSKWQMTMLFSSYTKKELAEAEFGSLNNEWKYERRWKVVRKYSAIFGLHITNG